MRLSNLLLIIVGLVLSADPSLAYSAEPAAPATPRAALYTLNADGSGWEKFFQLPQVTAIGSPSVSRDGKWIAFDGWMPDAGEGTSDSRLFVLSTARDELWLLGNGAMPTWGPDNTRLACSFYSGGAGLLTIASQETVTIDNSGWGTQWSPDGKSVAYAIGQKLQIYDLASKQSRTAFNAEGQYTSLGWNGTWSPDSQRFLFVGTTDDNKKDIVSVAVTGQDADLKKHIENIALSAKFAWHPTQPRLVFGKYDNERKRSQLFEIDPNKTDPPKRLEGQDTLLDVMSPTWTPDGKRLFCIVKTKVEPAKP